MADKKKKKSRKEKAEKPSVEIFAQVEVVSRLRRVATHRAFAAALLFLISFAVFIPSIHDGLVWDDIKYVQESADRYRSEKLSIGMLIPEAGYASKYFRPVYTASLIMDHKIWTSASLGFHLTNIFLHSITTVLLYFLILLLFREFGKEGGDKVALLSGLFFALYPLHVESVSFIAARGDILAAMFFFLCMIFYLLSFRKYWLILLAGVFLYFSFVSKEVAYSFPIVIMGFDVISRKILNRRNWLKYIFVGLPVIFYVLIRFGSYTSIANVLSRGDVQQVQGTIGMGYFVNIFFNTYLFYIKKLLYPYNLNSFIGTIPGGDAFHLILAILFVVCVCVAFVISMRKRENVTAFCLLWIFATLGPAVIIAIYPLAITRFAERFLYLPSAGYCLLVAYLIVNVEQRGGIKWAAWAVAVLLCVSFAIVTIRGQEVWRSNLVFWENAVRKSPYLTAPKLNYAYALKRAGRIDEAIIQYSNALSPELDTSNTGKAIAAFGLGSAYLQKGDYSNAEKSFKAANEYSPDFATQYNYYMGLVALQKNDLVTAEKYILNSLKLSPRFAKARILLARLYLAQGEVKKARQQARIALEMANDANDIREAKSIIYLN